MSGSADLAVPFASAQTTVCWPGNASWLASRTVTTVTLDTAASGVDTVTLSQAALHPSVGRTAGTSTSTYTATHLSTAAHVALQLFPATQTAIGTSAAATQTAQDPKLQAMQAALTKLQSSKDNGAAARADAKARVERLKQAIIELQLFYASDPKRLAGLVARLARALVAAVRDYVRAGGSSADLAVTSVSMPSSDTTNAAANGANAAANPVATSAASIADADRTAKTDSATETSTKSDPTEKSGAGDGAALRDDLERASFFKDVRGLERLFKVLLAQAKARMAAKTAAANPDVRDAKREFERIDRLIKQAEGTLLSIPSPAGTAVDVQT